MRYLACLTLLAAAACGGSSDGGTPPKTSTPAALTIAPVSTAFESIGDTRQLTATVTDASGAAMPNATVTWATSDQSIVTVSPTTGATTTVTSHGNGNASVTATASPATGQVAFAVAQKLGSLVLAPTTLSVAPGATAQISASALDAHGTAITGAATAATFQTSNAAAATVDASGLVHGVANGTATITGTLVRDGLTKTATSAVTVATSGGTTFPATAAVTATTSATFNPADVDIAAGGTVTWTFQTLTHNVTFAFANGVPSSIGNTTSATASRTFAVAGNFTYECTLHPGMTGAVHVH